MDRPGKEKNDLDATQCQSIEQKSQLDSLLEYKDECINGLANARETELTPVHVREYQLLMKHIDSIVGKIEPSDNARQENIESADQTCAEKPPVLKK